RLSDANDWTVRRARRILSERRDQSTTEPLRRLATSSDVATKLKHEALWTLASAGRFEAPLAEKLLASSVDVAQAWAVRLLGDPAWHDTPSREPGDGSSIEMLLAPIAKSESPRVRLQLACTAQRIPPKTAIALLRAVHWGESDLKDAYIPLAVW